MYKWYPLNKINLETPETVSVLNIKCYIRIIILWCTKPPLCKRTKNNLNLVWKNLWLSQSRRLKIAINNFRLRCVILYIVFAGVFASENFPCMSTKRAGVSVGSFTVVAWQKRSRGETKANSKHYRLSASSFLSFSISVLPQKSNEEPSLLPFSLFFYLRTCNSDLPCFRLFLASSPLSPEFVCSVLCRGECRGPSLVLQKNENCH